MSEINFYVINKLSEDPEMFRPLEVDGYTSGVIKHKVFCFTSNGKRQMIGLKKPDEYYNYVHHLNKEEVHLLGKMFPGSIPKREATVSLKLEAWGELVREELCHLIIDGKLYIDHKEPNGRIIRRKLVWIGPPYERNIKKMHGWIRGIEKEPII
ncbi:hypothetical protein [Paenibacillus sp. LHD-38]|uniref:hypothetical protein n=1 Tax=Paenibacillus sp. LHD-38 TaxID=3072143 RepID=UPI00280D52C0|nr:hypothetical protein [Paenibacillus sp. LHD-38]MDQ8734208.1 hypothetical protein [Paenibacillus sp. LHD-38]